MGYVPKHLYIVTGDKRFKKSYYKEEKLTIIGVIITFVIYPIFLFFILRITY